jgi:hypothetical protein
MADSALRLAGVLTVFAMAGGYGRDCWLACVVGWVRYNRVVIDHDAEIEYAGHRKPRATGQSV